MIEDVILGTAKVAGKVIVSGTKLALTGIKNAAAMASNICKSIFEKARNYYQGLDDYKLDKTIDVNYLRQYKKRNNTILVVANVGSLVQFSHDDNLISEVSQVHDEYIIAEYNENNDEVVQADFVFKEKIDDKIMTALNANDGVIIIK